MEYKNKTNNLPKRKSHRLKEYDYGQYGYYFVTICTHNRKPLLSKIKIHTNSVIVGNDALVVPKTILTPLGKEILNCWYNIEKLNNNVKLDKFVIMPNHIHGIIIIKNANPIDPIDKKFGFEIAERRGRRSLQGLVKDFKSVTTRIYKNMYGSSESLWQESFYDEIIKSERQYQDVWKYIDANPLMWHLDDLYANDL